VTRATELVASLYADAARCAEVAGLRYVSPDDPGIARHRAGRGFTYRDASGATVTDAGERARIAKLAIPPAWCDVWICRRADGHLLAVGDDERGRRQYLYHDSWRALRDQLNFYRLIGFGDALPTIRAHVDRQLRRRSLDTDRVLAAMLRIIDLAGLRVGNEEYVEENDSYGLSTLTKRHVRVHGASIEFRFPAKSGQRAEATVHDAGVARVLAALLTQRGRRLFTVAGSPVGSDEVNARLGELGGTHCTAKDFRTWHGTAVAFEYLRAHPVRGEGSDEARRRAAVDAAAAALGNTRTIAQAHYVHPAVLSDELAGYLDGRRARAGRWLSGDERLLLGYLTDSLERGVAELPGA
jgi:DNA topoisomerase-1